MKKLSETYKDLGITFSFPIEIKDAKGNGTYFEDSDGFWCRWEHDSKGDVTYYEDPEGVRRGTSRADFEGKVIEVDGIKYELRSL